jgi:hypothetical protein
MYNLMSFVDRQKKSLKMEKEMVNNGENPPTGILLWCDVFLLKSNILRFV